MDLDLLWERIFSEEAVLVRGVWNTLPDEERLSVRDFLVRVIGDPDRADAQRRAAQYAIDVVEAPPEGALEFARELVHQTGARLKDSSRQFTISTKQDGTLVTTLDVETDLYLCKEIQQRFPEHGVLSEEHDRMYRGQEWCWVIDPIDGTTNFAAGFPIWGVLVGLLHFGQPVMGVAEFPWLGYQFHAVRGQGSYLNDMRLRVSAATTFTSSDLFAICSRTARRGVLPIASKIRVPGSMGFEIASVACGQCVGNLGRTVHVWDVAALWPILAEAGGQAVTNISGGLFPLQAGVDHASVAFSMLTACTPELMCEARSRLREFFEL